MARSLNILFVASEVEPFAKTGGLADVAGALPKSLVALGNEVRVVLPRYGTISDKKFKLYDVQRLHNIPVPLGGNMEAASVKTSSLTTAAPKVPVYLVQNSRYFDREGLYVDSSTKSDYGDNDERFLFFSRAVFELTRTLEWKPDIIHCNDWQTGMLAAYAKTLYANDPFFKGTKIVFTIHNLAYQGRFPKSTFEKSGLPWSLFTLDGLEFFGDVNFLKAGIVYADAITTVSKKYAEEIASDPEFGYGLEGILRARSKSLFGILNGIDYSVWNPEIDSLIPHTFTVKDLEGKKANKKALQEKFGLEVADRTPLLGIISRLADQKGFDLLETLAPRLMEENIQLVVLGTGEPKYHTMLETLRAKFPNKVGVFLGFNNELAHLIEAGSDMFLMPSRYEPCGLNQMYSLKYGTVPIVRATGGLDDTIEDFDTATKKGTGFKFHRYSAEDFFVAISRAISTYHNPQLWKALMTNGMKKDFSWDASAKKYVDLYRDLLD